MKRRTMRIYELVIPKGKHEVEQRSAASDFNDRTRREREENRWTHEEVIRARDENLDLTVYIAVHNTVLGPGLGGCRIWDYPGSASPEHAALHDVLRLSEAMTWKNSAAGLDLGGGKAVMLRNPHFTVEREAAFRSLGLFVDALHGAYIVAEDMGATGDDMACALGTTKYVASIPRELDGSGDSSPMTAYGVLKGIEAAAQFLGMELRGARIALQGACGHVAEYLIPELRRHGARLILCDIEGRHEALEHLLHTYDAEKIIEGERIYEEECDIFCPSAVGAVLGSRTIPLLQKNGVRIVAGAANNQLEDYIRDGTLIHESGILYAPDFIINSGGVINLSFEPSITGKPYDETAAREKTEKIHERLTAIFEESKASNKPTASIALRIAKERIDSVRHRTKPS